MIFGGQLTCRRWQEKRGKGMPKQTTPFKAPHAAPEAPAPESSTPTPTEAAAIDPSASGEQGGASSATLDYQAVANEILLETAPEIKDGPTLRDIVESKQPLDGGTEIQAPITYKPRSEGVTTMSLPRTRGLLRLPDGSIRLEVTIPPEEAMLIEGWAESAQTPLEQYINEQVIASLQAYCSSQG
jgi:hypothetical protein